MIKNQDVVSSLTNKLPSFYHDFLYDKNLINALFDAYVDIFEHMTNHVKSVYYNTFLESAEILRGLNKSVLTLYKALYKVDEVAELFEAAGHGDWFSEETTLKDKILFLESLGFYEVIDANRPFDVSLRDIVDLSIAKDFSESLGYYTSHEDYIVVNNKLFLFNDLAKPPEIGGIKKVMAKDILVDYQKIDNRWGVIFDSLTKDYLTPLEYKDFIEALVTFSPTAAKMKAIARNLMSKENGDLYDAFTRKNVSKEHLFGRPEFLGPFDFVFKLPPDLIEALYYIPPELIGTSSKAIYRDDLYKIDYKNTEPVDQTLLYYTYLRGKIGNIRNFLNLLKPSYTSFFLEGTMYIDEDMEDGKLEDNLDFKLEAEFFDSIEDCNDLLIYDLATYDSAEYEGQDGEWDEVSLVVIPLPE